MLKSGKHERLFADLLRETISEATDVLDVGTPRRFAKELAPYRDWFHDKRYVAAGYEPDPARGENADCHQDVQAMTFADCSFDAILCLEVLEHVPDPFAAAQEIVRVLRPGGRLFLTTPFLTGYHGKGGASAAHDSYPDFWRFTHEGLALLFRDLGELRVMPLDGPIEVRVRLLTRRDVPGLLRPILDRIDRAAAGRASSRHLLVGRKR